MAMRGYGVGQQKAWRACGASVLALSLFACGGGGGSDTTPVPSSGTTPAPGGGSTPAPGGGSTGGSDGGLSVSGTVSGLPSGSTLTLSDNGGDTLTVKANGAFTFATKLAAGSSYAVTASANLNYLSCVVSHGTGTANASVTNVAVSCLPWQVSTIGGDGTAGTRNSLDNGLVAEFANPLGITVGPRGDIFVADTNLIRVIEPTGTVLTEAGNQIGGYADGACNNIAKFYNPRGLVVDVANNVYVADSANNIIRQITPNTTSGCTVSTLAGIQGSGGNQNGSATSALFQSPQGIALDAAGNLYVADTTNSSIRMITPAGTVSTLADNSKANGTGDLALLRHPIGVAVDSAGNVYVADHDNNAVRMITPAGVVSTLAGAGQSQAGFVDGAASSARFNGPDGVAVDSKGNVYVADDGNNAVRMITPAGVVTTIAGSASSGHADGDGATALFNQPTAIAVDSAGNLYVTEYTYIRKISPPMAP